MIAIIAIMLLTAVVPEGIYAVNEILIWISAALTIISGGIYLKEYWKYIDPAE